MLSLTKPISYFQPADQSKVHDKISNMRIIIEYAYMYTWIDALVNGIPALELVAIVLH